MNLTSPLEGHAASGITATVEWVSSSGDKFEYSKFRSSATAEISSCVQLVNMSVMVSWSDTACVNPTASKPAFVLFRVATASIIMAVFTVAVITPILEANHTEVMVVR
jgi:hypothetical protein